MTGGRALSLYRSLLRAHAKHLPTEMRQLGDAYVKSEFRAHKAVTNPEQLQNFFSEWQSYLDQLLMTARARESVSSGALDDDKREKPNAFQFGRDLSQNVDLSEEQLTQLEKLRDQASKAGRSGP